MSTVGQGPALSLGFRSQFQRPSGVELLRDGFNHEASPAAWSSLQASVSYPLAVLPDGSVGTVLRVTGDGVNAYGAAYQGVLSAGRTFRTRCWVRTDGVAAVPSVAYSGLTLLNGVVNPNWIELDLSGISKGINVFIGKNSSATGWVEYAFESIQEVIQVTLDDATYTAPYTYLGCDAGGATECAGLRKLDLIDRHTSVRTTLADFSANPGAGSACTLPSGWNYSCATSARTTQVSSGSLTLNVSANVAPWKSVDNLSGSLNVEKSTTNAIVRSNEFNLVLWVKAATMGLTPGDDVGPDNVPASATRITPTVIGDFLTTYFSGIAGQVWMFSYWVKQHSLNQLRVIAYSATLGTNISVVDVTSRMVVGEWRRIDVMFGIPAGGTGTIYVYPHVQGIAPSGGYAWIYGAQAELGAGLTSYVPTAAAAITRASATLSVPHDQVAFDNGRVPEMVWIPSLAYNEATYDWIIMDDSRGRLYYEQSTQKFVFTVYGRGTIKSLACTFSREQAITLRADVDGATQLATLVVSGCTTGNGTFQTYVQERRAAQMGDGHTAARFPTQLYPRGVTTPNTGTENVNTNSIDLAPLRRVGTVVVDVYLSPLSISEASTHTLIVQALTGAGYATGVLLSQFGANLYGYWGTTSTTVAAVGLTAGYHSIAMTCDGTTVSLYVDGRILNYAALTSVSNNVGLGVGGVLDAVLNAVHQSRIYGAKVYRYALTATQLKELHERFKLEINR